MQTNMKKFLLLLLVPSILSAQVVGKTKTEEYKAQYGPRTIFIEEVGGFMEVYGLKQLAQIRVQVLL